MNRRLSESVKINPVPSKKKHTRSIMKIQRLLAVLTMTIQVPVSAQFIVDNIDEPLGFLALLHRDDWHATSFTTGPNPDGYDLQTVTAVFFPPNWFSL